MIKAKKIGKVTSVEVQLRFTIHPRDIS